MKQNSRFRKFLSMFMVLAMLMQYGLSVPVFAEDGADSEALQAAAAQEAKAAQEAEEKAAAERAAAEKAAAEKAAAEKAAAEQAAAEKAAAEQAAAEKAAAEQAAAEQQSSQNDTAAPQQANEPEQKQEESQDQVETGQDDTSGQEQLDLENARAPDETDETVADEALAEEELAVEEVLEEEEEDKYPAVSLHGSANGISVSVSAPEGALPEGTTLKVTGAGASGYIGAIENIVDGHVDAVKAVDITFYKDGSEVHPKKAVKVTMTSSVFSKGEDHTVLHVSGGGLEVVSSGAKGNSASFSSKDFSVYLMAASTASYEVKFVANGSVVDTKYYDKTDSEVLGSLPDAPTKHGTTFKGWKISGQDDFVTESTVVTGDYTINAVYSDMTVVRFVMNNGSDEELVAQYDVVEGTKIGMLPEEPFKEGFVFDKWVNSETGETVTADTEVPEGGLTAVAQFKEIAVYNVSVSYYYTIDGRTNTFGHEAFELSDSDIENGYVITPPPSTQVDAEYHADEPIYYASVPSITITADDFDESKTYETSVEYVEYTAEYDFVYLLKGPDGNYSEMEREHVRGVIGTSVTPTVKEYPYADFEKVESHMITEASGQELPVYYTPKTLSLTFNTNGGSYIAAVNDAYGVTVDLTDKEPTKGGYEFAGWFRDEALTEEAGDSVKLESNMTLYAKWNPAPADYTIVYMFEKYNDAGTSSSYVYDNSATGTATVGTTVTANDPSIPDKTRAGWEKNTSMNAESSVEIKADGSSVLYVYYQLKEYTFEFNAGTITTGNVFNARTHNVTATLTGKGVSGQGKLSYTMKVKLGQDISGSWPYAVTGTYYDGNRTRTAYFDGWKPANDNVTYVTKRITVTADMLPSSGSTLTYTALWTTQAYKTTVNYWLQNANDNQYTKSDVYSQEYYSSGGTLGPKDISGYTYVRSKNKSEWWGVYEYNFYYDRDTFNIEYYDGGNRLRTIRDVKFDANISGNIYNWKPANPAGKEDYTWGGWYEDADLSSSYKFTTMPAHDVAVYAKWIAPQYTVTYDTQGGTADFDLTDTVDKGSKVSFPGTPVKEHYTFAGWYTAAEGGQLYDWNTPVTADITLYAQWKPVTLSYVVHYYKAGTTESLLADKAVTNPALEIGQTITEHAPGVAGYRPDSSDKSIALEYEGNEITFYYSERSGEVSYTVNYVLKDHPSIKVHESKTVTVDAGTVQVIELAAAANHDYIATQTTDEAILRDSYYPLKGAATLVLVADEAENVITFEYANYKTTEVTVKYLDMDGNAIPGKPAVHEYLKKGTTYQVDTAAPNGYYYHHVTDNNGESHTTYNITGEGQLVISVYYQKAITIVAANQSKAYDGTPLKSPEGLAGLATMPELEAGHTLKGISFIGEQTNVGSHSTVPANAVIEGCSKNFYHITYVPGTLTVTPVDVLIIIEPDRYTTAKYNGTEQSAGFTNTDKKIGDYVKINVPAYKDAHLADFSGLLNKALITQTNAGDYNLTAAQVEAAVRRLIDLPSDDNYRVSYEFRNAQLTIAPKAVTITAADSSKTYGEDDPEFADATISEYYGEELDGIDLTVTRQNADEDVDTYEGVLTISDSETELNTEYTNYRFTVIPGSFTINPAGADEIGLTVSDYRDIYDGQPHTINASVDVEEGTTIYYSKNGSDWSETAPTWTNATFDDASESIVSKTVYVKAVNANYGEATAQATVTITKKTITVSDSANETYDGTEKTLTITADNASGLVSGETLTLTGAVIKGTDAKTYTSIAPYNWTVTKASGASSVNNYELEVSGKLIIAPAAIKVTAESGSKIYGEADPESFGATVDGTVYGDDSIEYSVSRAEGEDAGNYTVKAEGKSDQGNYKVTFVNGTFVINKANLVVKTGSAEKPYDGTALINAEASIEGLVTGDTATVTANGTQTEVGSSKNGYSIAWGTAKAGNYTITEELGTLKVTEAEEEEVIPTPPTPPTPPVPGTTDDDDDTPTPAAPAVTPATPAAPAAVIADEPVPQAEPEAEIEDAPAPLAPPAAPWALINLICAALSAVGAAIALFRRKEDDEEDDEEKDEDEDDNRGRNMTIAKVLGVLLAAASIITFILTEDMSGPMQLTDKWTILMAVLFAGQIFTAVANKKASESEDEEEENAEA